MNIFNRTVPVSWTLGTSRSVSCRTTGHASQPHAALIEIHDQGLIPAMQENPTRFIFSPL